MTSALLSTGTLLAVLATTATCQKSNLGSTTIGSCADVGCNIGNSTSGGTTCDVGSGPDQEHLSEIGFRSFKTPASGKNFTLTVGYGENTQLEKFYYLGTPPSLDLKHADFHACSIFFTGTNVGIDPPDTGNCDSLLPKGCGKDIEEQGMHIVKNPTNGTKWNSGLLCQALMDHFSQKLADSCSAASDSKKAWTDGVDASIVSGFRGPDLVKSKGGCHPTLPKSNDLSLLYSFNQTGLGAAENTNRVVPVLTVMDTDQPYSHLECMAAIPNRGDGKTQGNDAVAGVSRYSVWATGLLTFIAAGFLSM